MQVKILFTVLVVMAWPASALATPTEEITEYAQTTGKTYQEAERCLTLQDKAAALPDTLRNGYGFWFETATCRYKVPVPTTATTYTTAAKKAVGKAKLLTDTDFVRTRDLQTRTQLEQQQAQLNADPDVSSAILDGSVHTSIDVKANQPKLTQAPSLTASEDEQMRGIAEDYGAGWEEGPAAEFPARATACNYPHCNTPLRGGVYIQTPTGACTAGPMAMSGVVQFPRDFVMVTAGHCSLVQGQFRAWTPAGVNHVIGTRGGLVFGAEGDTAMIPVAHTSHWDSLRPRGYINWNSLSEHTLVRGSEWSFVGMNVCTSGAGPVGIRPRSCGIVTETNITLTYAEFPGVRVGRLTKAWGACSYPGDSGGPMWSNNKIKGHSSGGYCGSGEVPDGVTWFIEMRRTEAQFNLCVLNDYTGGSWNDHC